MRSLLTFAVLCTVFLFVGGCAANLEKAILGKYAVEVSNVGTSEMDKASAEVAKSVSLEIMEGNKAEMTVMGQKLPGKWKLEGNKLAVTPDRGGSPAKFTVEDGGKTLKPDVSDAKDKPKGVTITFKKQ